MTSTHLTSPVTVRPKLSALVLNVQRPDRLAEFYCRHLGMSRVEHSAGIALGYEGKGALLVLNRALSAGTYEASKNDRYWKFSITLPNLDLAHQKLTRENVSASTPHQFREIAYMSHLKDPEGHVIELIQHTFEDKIRTSEGDVHEALGGGAKLALITLRTADIKREKERFVDELGMRLLSRQALSDIGFDLYFFAFSDEKMPSNDVDAVENREWLWQRDYTSLEFQYLLGRQRVLSKTPHALGAAKCIIEDSRGKEIVFE